MIKNKQTKIELTAVGGCCQKVDYNKEYQTINLDISKQKSFKINGRKISGNVSKIEVFLNPTYEVRNDLGVLILEGREPGIKSLSLTIDFENPRMELKVLNEFPPKK